jgi:outer membrane protein TolC
MHISTYCLCRFLSAAAVTLFLAAGARSQSKAAEITSSSTRLINPVGAESNAAPDGSQQAPGPLLINLPDAQARAAATSKVAELAKLSAAAARYHRQAAQGDYFPKIGSTFVNLHFNKFMGEEIALRNGTAHLPLLNKDQSLVAVTATQPVTPLFKVREAVRLARADERIAQAKADAVAGQVAANVERTYLSLLVAQRQQLGAEIKLKMMVPPAQIASTAIWGYSYQTGIPLLPRDFSFVGVLASWNVFDFGKRERTVKERDTGVRMAEINLELVRAKVAASLNKASFDLQRTRRTLQLTRKVASMYQAVPAHYQAASLETREAQTQAEMEMFQAELDYRLAYAELKRVRGVQ